MHRVRDDALESASDEEVATAGETTLADEEALALVDVEPSTD